MDIQHLLSALDASDHEVDMTERLLRHCRWPLIPGSDETVSLEALSKVQLFDACNVLLTILEPEFIEVDLHVEILKLYPTRRHQLEVLGILVLVLSSKIDGMMVAETTQLMIITERINAFVDKHPIESFVYANNDGSIILHENDNT